MAIPRKTPTPIALWMVLSIACLGGIALWDERRESNAALDDFAEDQATTARGVGAALRARVASSGSDLGGIAATVRAVEEPGATRVFFRPEGAAGWFSTEPVGADGGRGPANPSPAHEANEAGPIA